MSDESLIQSLLDGNRTAVARAMTLAEKDGPEAIQLLQAVHGHTGTAHRVGITGPPGAGKSTLINQLVTHLRADDLSVAVLAIDPTSPFTDGALLGDRLRMMTAGQDSEVFIRSMASRGSSGGLSHTAHDAANILDAAGFDFILIETVGVGQSELDIASVADTVLVVVVPESGDSVQAMKAGLMEIADIFVLNKCDRPDSDNACAAIQSMLNLHPQGTGEWMRDIVQTVASEGQGTDDLARRIAQHRKHLVAADGLRKRQEKRLRYQVKKIVEKTIRSALWDEEGMEHLAAAIQPVLDGKLSPHELAQSIVDRFRR